LFVLRFYKPSSIEREFQIASIKKYKNMGIKY